MPYALLINPPIHDFAAFDLWMKPLGLLYAGAALEAAGWRVELLDCLDRLHPSCPAPAGKTQPRLQRFGCGAFPTQTLPAPEPLHDVPRTYRRFGLPPEIVRQELARRTRPDLIAVTSMMTYWYPGVFEAVALARDALPGIPIVLGGVYATLCTDHAEAASGADYVVAGAGEEKLLALAGQIAAAGSEVDLSSLRPAYHLMGRLTSISVLTSRGCPFGCTYCASRLLCKGFTQRDVDQVVNEIDALTDRCGVREVAFYDDALLVDARSHIVPILRALRRRRPELRFHTPNGLHARMVDEELARELRQSRFTTIRLSFETASEQRQIDSNRKITNNELRQVIRTLLAAGYTHREIEVYVLMGLPGQEIEELDETLRFVHDAGGWIKIAQFSPIPGTEEFERARRLNPAITHEPLLHNNSIFSAACGPDRFAPFQRMKRLANTLNAALARGQDEES